MFILRTVVEEMKGDREGKKIIFKAVSKLILILAMQPTRKAGKIVLNG